MADRSALGQPAFADIARELVTSAGPGADTGQWLAAGRPGPLAGTIYAEWRIGSLASAAESEAIGGLGTIYRCARSGSNEPGLLEILTGSAASDSEAVRGLLAKAREALPLVSPAVLRVLHTGTWAGVPFTLRQFDHDTNLGKVIQRLRTTGERLQLALVLDLVAQIAHALAEAEAVGIAHGELQPSWVRVSSYGVIRIAGFGRARQRVVDSTYRAPEITDGPGDQRSDQYALGCMLYELCCGRPPFTAKTAVVLRRRQCFREPTSPARLNPDLGPEPLAVILSCLQKRPEDRYAKMADLARDLAALHAGTLTSAVQRGLTSTGGWAAYRAHLGALAVRWAWLAAILAVIFGACLAWFTRIESEEKSAKGTAATPHLPAASEMKQPPPETQAPLPTRNQP